MASTLIGRYNSQYLAWSRQRRGSPGATTPRQQPGVQPHPTDVYDLVGQLNAQARAQDGAEAAKDKKKQETLFGPNIGIVSSGPDWTCAKEKETKDELTLDTVKNWIVKSKEGSHPTTTLQALVNLKRPTLRLTPLEKQADDETHDHHHALEFEYDCDAPKCAIDVSVVLAADAPADPKDLTRVPVFNMTTDGGFGRRLTLDDGAILELGHFEHHAGHDAQPSAGSAPSDPTGATNPPDPTAPSASTHTTAANGTADAQSQAARRRRFSHFHIRRRTGRGHANRSIAGPALAVVDAEAGSSGAQQGGGSTKDAKGTQDDEGVRVVITLRALDAEGVPLSSPNEQATYLHVVRFGHGPAPAAEGEEQQEVEDTRPWVVKVVKREAIIGPHTFQLHEIYGLSSYSNTPSHPVSTPAPAPAAENAAAEPHTYPPTSPAPAPPADDEPSSECLLCLSSPREVVLLPCRHLVACKDCAINMVEFGAGGTIVQPEEPVAEAAGTSGEGGDGANGATTAAPAAPAPAPSQPRRKRKAKGWFCPVCRQPYTSLLRITTTPPAVTEKSQPAEDAAAPASPAPAAATETPASPPVSTGPLSSLSRPGFLRGLSRGVSRNPAPSSTLPPDLERGAAPAENPA
ncbi:hypothetical protein PUNSTDRAFT_52848 [Punctularia strigosozonata HHB-11173 SS5]|uniref:uncharacterized protein n=1 Tax=Punctularia strigosozonata (strain HHB-11173) TaxID=741275 RepID=UPI0004417B79|nr:uncharacterized protein PUNSTDRAFT_52848 [Punctularia strigosozonata HHB-11173 SS5]EIN08449.1 hypothetical protein PUNSTDRAFT_52848 [Punctularia strigosozonata HHB-11173 SS5]